MQFTFDYFEDEVRNGFYVSSLMKRFWAAQLKVLKVIDEVCKEHKITWYLHSGTLLGAVRHRGYIPWDDDLDIAMKREDYERFKIIFKEQKHGGFLFHDYETKYYSPFWGRVVNSDEMDFSKERLDAFYGMPYIVGVDIFPLDAIAPTQEEEMLRCDLAKAVLEILEQYQSGAYSLVQLEPQLKRIEDICAVTLSRNEGIEAQLIQLIIGLFQAYNGDDSEDIASVYFWMKDGNHRYPKRCFAQTTRLCFEEMLFPAPIEYRSVLEHTYHDYYRIVRGGAEHEYPCFENQEKKWLARKGILPYRYDSNRLPIESETGIQRHEGTPLIVFLPDRATHWNAFRSIWEAARQNPDIEVCVMPVPYYEIDVLGQLGARHYDGECFPEEVEIHPFDLEYLAERKPEVILIQNPYDQYTCGLCVDPQVYTPELKKWTSHLVYIPKFTLDEIQPEDTLAMKTTQYFIPVPGVINADFVVLQSEQMRDLYVRVLTETTPLQDPSYWLSKMIGIGSPLWDVQDSVFGPKILDAILQRLKNRQ